MKYLKIIIALNLVFSFSCLSVLAKPGLRFSVEGKVKGLKTGTKLFMVVKWQGKIDTVSKATAKNEAFTFAKIKLPVYPAMYLICIQTEFVDNLELFLDQAGDVKVAGELAKWPNVAVTGSKTHDDYLACNELRKEIRAKDFNIKHSTGIARADSVNIFMLKECEQIIKQRPESYYPAYWIATVKNPVEITYPNYKVWPYMKKTLYDLLSPEVKSSPYGKILKKQIENYDANKERLEQLKNVSQDLESIRPAEVLNEMKTSIGAKIKVRELPLLTHTAREMDLKNKLEKTTVILNMAYKEKDEMLSNPTTAYVIDDSGICVTNYHVGNEYSSNESYRSLSIMTVEGKVYPVTEILSCSKKDDLMIFQVDTRGDKLYALPLGNATPEGTIVYVMGHPRIEGHPRVMGLPMANFYRLTSGKVIKNTTSTLAGNSCTIMNITADFSIGSSGGPIVDDKGNLIGTVSRIDWYGAKVGIPITELKKLITLKKEL